MRESFNPRGAYKTFDEQRKIYFAEQRFETARQATGNTLATSVFLAMLLVPLRLEQNQQTLAAILSFTIVYWLSEAIPIPATAVLALALCVLLNVPASASTPKTRRETLCTGRSPRTPSSCLSGPLSSPRP